MSESEITYLNGEVIKTCNDHQGLVEASFLRLVNHPKILQPSSIEWISRRLQTRMTRLKELGEITVDIDKLLRDLIEILAYLEVNDISHNDIKPNNILYDPKTGDYILIDFGIATRYERCHQERLGTIYIRAPELFEDKRIKDNPSKPRNDIFSLGATIYSLSVGHSWIRRQYKKTQLYLTPNDDPELYPFIVQEALDQRYLEKYKGPHKDLIRRMMAPNPADRPSGVQIANELGTTNNYRYDPIPKIDSSLISKIQDLRYKNSSVIVDKYIQVHGELPLERVIQAAEAISDLICVGTLPPETILDDIIEVSIALNFRLMWIF
jgi:serine/threonine protein kinase